MVVTKGLVGTLALAALVAAACTSVAQPGRSSLPSDPSSYDESPTTLIAQAAILDAKGVAVASASFRDTRLGTRVEVRAVGLPPGKHGIHMHAASKCEPPDFATAGGHFNVSGKQHGIAGSVSAHAGDLPNLVVGADGKGSLLFYNPHLTLNRAASNGLAFGPGTSIVVHADADDERTEPSGNSGARIACGLVKVVG